MKIGLLGVTGRMGLANLKSIIKDDSLALGAAICSPNNEFVGKDAAKLALVEKDLGVIITSDIESVINDFDVLIDFSNTKVSMNALRLCAKHNKPVLVASTGFSKKEESEICKLSSQIPVVLAANTSVGVNLCAKLLQIAGKLLASDYDIEIIEAHHKNKVDAPSGTALFLGKEVAKAANKDFDKVAAFDRTSHMNAREEGEIGFSVIRAGDIKGEHTVLFANDLEAVEIKHTAYDRSLFANGAMRAAKWLASCNKAGLYSMYDVLGLD